MNNRGTQQQTSVANQATEPTSEVLNTPGAIQADAEEEACIDAFINGLKFRTNWNCDFTKLTMGKVALDRAITQLNALTNSVIQLDFDCSNMTIELETMAHLCEGIKKQPKLSSVTIIASEFSAAVLQCLAEAIIAHAPIKILALNGAMNDQGLRALAQILEANRLEEMHLPYSRPENNKLTVTNEGLKYIADGLKHNDSLTHLTFLYNSPTAAGWQYFLDTIASSSNATLKGVTRNLFIMPRPSNIITLFGEVFSNGAREARKNMQVLRLR